MPCLVIFFLVICPPLGAVENKRLCLPHAPLRYKINSFILTENIAFKLESQIQMLRTHQPIDNADKM